MDRSLQNNVRVDLGTACDADKAYDAENVAQRLVVLINGLPGAGKTTLARALSRRLGLPMFSKDVIKETHADVIGAEPLDDRPQREWNRQLGAAASATMWPLLADSPRGAVLESTWPSRETWEYVQAGLAFAGVERPLQIWCEIPLALARERFELRHMTRHAVHGEQPDDEEWSGRWALATPLPISDTLRVDTTHPLTWLRSRIGASADAAPPDTRTAFRCC